MNLDRRNFPEKGVSFGALFFFANMIARIA
jgi:hypothetical protein